MDLSSWFRRTTKKSTKIPNPPKPQGQQEQEQEEQLLGVTEQLIDFVKSFTFDTFKNFHLQDNEDETPTTSGNVRNDLSEWQERHATLVLSQIKIWVSGNFFFRGDLVVSWEMQFRVLKSCDFKRL
uniref:Uncharacterized protein n=1 Tax=Fagus sylvatica TaxID=28930 RepID=A0A2N9J5P9_FAGSY